MALKDWKKRKYGWRNQRDGDSLFIQKLFPGNKWYVAANFLTGRTFKTKAQALKVAKSYMRKY